MVVTIMRFRCKANERERNLGFTLNKHLRADRVVIIILYFIRYLRCVVFVRIRKSSDERCSQGDHYPVEWSRRKASQA
jgi:hypothetical protein